jgi:hypothetical protein
MFSSPTPPITIATGGVEMKCAPQAISIRARESPSESLQVSVPAPFPVTAVPTAVLPIMVTPAGLTVEDGLLLRGESGIEGFESRSRGLQVVDLEAQHGLGQSFPVESRELGVGLGRRGQAGGTQLLRPGGRGLAPFVPERLLLGIELEPGLEIRQMSGLAGVMLDANLLRRKLMPMVLGAVRGGPRSDIGKRLDDDPPATTAAARARARRLERCMYSSGWSAASGKTLGEHGSLSDSRWHLTRVRRGLPAHRSGPSTGAGIRRAAREPAHQRAMN